METAMSDKKRGNVLLDALNVINGERQDQYGSPEDNFETIATYWTTYLNGRSYISGKDVAMMMTLLKVARIQTGTATWDSFLDACGYMALASDMTVVTDD